MLFTAWGRLYTGADFTASHCGNIYLQALSIATNKLWLHHVMVMSQSHSSVWVSLNQLMVDIEWFKYVWINYHQLLTANQLVWICSPLFLAFAKCPVAQEPGMRCQSTLSERGLGGAWDNALPWQWSLPWYLNVASQITWSRGPNSFALLWNGTPPLLDPSLVAVPWHREVSMSSMLSLYII